MINFTNLFDMIISPSDKLGASGGLNLAERVERNTLEDYEDQEDFDNLLAMQGPSQVEDRSDKKRIPDDAEYKKAVDAVSNDVKKAVREDKTVEVSEDAPREAYAKVAEEVVKEIGNEVEDLGKAIADLDLDIADGLEEILAHSNRVDALNALKQLLEQALEQLEEEIAVKLDLSAEQVDNLELEIDKLLEFIEDNGLGEELAKHINKNQIELELPEQLKDLRSLKPEQQKFSDLSDLDMPGDVELMDYKVSDSQKMISSVDSLDPERIKLELDEGEAELDVEFSDMEADAFADSNAGDGAEEMLSHHENTKAFSLEKSSKGVQVYREPVSINQLSNTLLNEVNKATPNIKQEIRMMLNPENLGSVELTITKDAANRVLIKMVFATDNAMNNVEHRVNELKAVLKSRGYEPSIELSKSEANEGTENHSGKQEHSFNEARDEQKERILNTAPEWLDKADLDLEASFESRLDGILD